MGGPPEVRWRAHSPRSPFDPIHDPLGLDLNIDYEIGRYEGCRAAPKGANELFVGRGRIREQFVDWLLRRSRCGAILITGARGAGKSTFVDTCLNDYEDRIFSEPSRLGPVGKRAGALRLIAAVHLRLWIFPLLCALAAHVVVGSVVDGVRGLLAAAFCIWSAMLATRVARHVWRAASEGSGASRGRPSAVIMVLALGAVLPLCIAFVDLSWMDPSNDTYRCLWLFAGASGAVSAHSLWLFSQSKLNGPRRFWRAIAGDRRALLRVKVNLGFDNLDQTAVARAMLCSLREAHARTFLQSWSIERQYQRIGAIIAIVGVTAFGGALLTAAGTHLRSSLPAPLTRALAKPYFWTQARAADPFSMQVNGYHLVLAFVLALTWRKHIGQLGSSHHSELNRRIQRTIVRLDSSARTSRKRDLRAKLRALPVITEGVVGVSDEEALESPKLDPRQVELDLIELIRRVAQPRLTNTLLDDLLLPSGEVIFIFDELDKVGSHRRFLDTLARTEDPKTFSTSYFSSERNREIHQLLSDMKNLMSSAPARFVFIAGRDLDDEWLADRTARNPLVSTLFDDAIYVPSLLDAKQTQSSTPATGNLLWGTRAFLKATVASSLSRAEYVARKRVETRVRATWSADWQDAQVLVEAGQPNVAPWLCHVPKHLWTSWEKTLVATSRGNLKRLEELFTDVVRRSKPDGARENEADSDVVRFSYTRRYLAGVHAATFDGIKHLSEVAQHDKDIQSPFYLTEFLFKFHRRAFHWSSLELLEELVDVHHSPDLRGVLSKIVRAWSESYLVPIEFGLYKFRFDSSFAAELRYASRISEFAMASFNFTLDETQILKQEYERRLRVAQERREDELTTRTALGELFDFEEDFQRARFHYAAAIGELDNKICSEKREVMLKLVGVDLSNPAEKGRADIDWSICRIFNKLRLGLTYEKSRDYVDAMAHYLNARTIAAAMMHYLLEPVLPGYEPRKYAWLEPDGNKEQWLDTAKMLQLLFQPMFATAWAAEKSRGPSSGTDIIADIRTHACRVLTEQRACNQNGVSRFQLTLADIEANIGAFHLARGRGHTSSAVNAYRASIANICDYLVALGEESPPMGRAATKVAVRLAGSLLGLADACLASGDLDEALAVPPEDDYQDLLNAIEDGTWRCEARWKPRTHVHDYLRYSGAAVRLLQEAGFPERADRQQLARIDILTGVLWSARVYQRSKYFGSDAASQRVASAFVAEATSHAFTAKLAGDAAHLLASLRSAAGIEQAIDTYVEQCRERLLDRPYPVFSGLGTLRELIRCESERDMTSQRMLALQSAAETLIRSRDEYDSDVHFTPYSLGSTLAMVGRVLGKNGKAVDHIEARALRALRQSRECVSQRGAYRTLIAGHYFLEDGFNDRALLSGQAYQSYVLLLTEHLIGELEQGLAAKRSTSAGV